jgi:hypothetical protein
MQLDKANKNPFFIALWYVISLYEVVYAYLCSRFLVYLLDIPYLIVLHFRMEHGVLPLEAVQRH